MKFHFVIRSYVKVYATPLDADYICSRRTNRPLFNMILADWERTHSPTAYWSEQLSPANYHR